MTRTLRRVGDGRVVCERCVAAETFWTRFRGLMGRASLPQNEGMVFRGASSIHMFFMRFPIDVAFVDRRGTILQVRHSLRPWRLALALRAFAAVEMPSGTLIETDTRAGDRLVVTAQP